MIVDAIQYFQMEVHGCTVGNGIEEFTYHLCIHLSDPLGSKGRIIIQIRSAGQVNGAQSQGLIHRKQKMPIAFDTFFLTKGFLNRLSEHNSGIFDGMVTIHIEIPVHVDSKIEKSVTGKTGKHMIEETDSGGNISHTLSVQIQLDGNLCFFCNSFNYCTSIRHILFLLIFKTNMYGIGMCGKLFCFCKGFDIFVNPGKGIFGVRNNTGLLHKIVYGER